MIECHEQDRDRPQAFNIGTKCVICRVERAKSPEGWTGRSKQTQATHDVAKSALRIRLLADRPAAQMTAGEPAPGRGGYAGVAPSGRHARTGAIARQPPWPTHGRLRIGSDLGVVEVFGTFALVTVAAGGDAFASLASGEISAAARAIAPALMVAALIYAIGDASGAHFNPVVTLAFAMRGLFPVRLVPGYWTAQIGGALLGGASFASSWDRPWSAGSAHRTSSSRPSPWRSKCS